MKTTLKIILKKTAKILYYTVWFFILLNWPLLIFGNFVEREPGRPVAGFGYAYIIDPIKHPFAYWYFPALVAFAVIWWILPARFPWLNFKKHFLADPTSSSSSNSQCPPTK